MNAKREQLMIDPKKCTGCGRCMIACAMKHFGTVDPGFSRVKILRFHPHAINVPVICMACDRAPCIKVCPMNARVRETNGSVTTRTEVCIGCKACVYICPVGSPSVTPHTGRTMTCDMCHDDDGGPWCVAACKLEGALSLARIGLPTSAAARERADQGRKILPL